ncbi:hypothetical protein MHYP_G00069060 [Metynnis hypsauchen]
MLGVIIREGKYSSRFSADAAVGERGGGGAGCAVGAAAHVTEQDYWRAASPERYSTLATESELTCCLWNSGCCRCKDKGA